MSTQPQYYQQKQLDDRNNLQHFQQFLTKALIPAKNPAAKKQQQQHFVSSRELEEYFGAPGRLEDILCDVFPDGDDPLPNLDIIRDNYLKAFCILLSTGNARYIRLFMEHASLADSKLPFASEPANFPIASGHNIWDAFSAQQWAFCAQEVTYKENILLDPDQVVPIIAHEVVASGNSADISKITLHECFDRLPYNGDVPLSSSPKHVYILKSYRGPDAKLYYENEVDAFKRLRAKQKTLDTNIVTFYGSYRQNDTFNVLLEYADEGTLETYFNEVFPPRSGSDIHQFWESLCGVLKALTQIHEVECPYNRGGPQIFQGWHQDVKPNNILVMSNGTNSPYRRKFKLADLGLSHFKRFSHGNSDFDAYGTETYGAPECYRAADRFFETSMILVKQNVDVWSFGCILSEAAVWLVRGFAGLKAYRQSRSEQISRIPGIKKGDWFHDGDKALPIVLQTLDELPNDFSKSDRVTKFVIDQLVKDMLDTPQSRSSASRLSTLADRTFRGANTIDLSPVPATLLGSENDRLTQSPVPLRGNEDSSLLPIPTSLSIPTSVFEPSQRDGDFQDRNGPQRNMPTQSAIIHNNSTPYTTRVSKTAETTTNGIPPVSPSPQQASEHIFSSIGSTTPQRRLDSATPRNSSGRPLPTLTIGDAERWIQDKKRKARWGPVKQLPNEYLLGRLETRDHVFIIDDAISMETHSAAVKRILSILAYLVKDSDPDGTELYFTGSMAKFKSNKSSVLVDAFVRNRPEGFTDIRTRLTKIINKYIEALSNTHRARIMRAFKAPRSLNIYVLTDGIWQPGSDLSALIRRLVEAIKLNGQCQVGIQFISFGDNLEALKRLNCLDNDLGVGHDDIVDHEPSNGNVWKMLFGATNPWFDNGDSIDSP